MWEFCGWIVTRLLQKDKIAKVYSLEPWKIRQRRQDFYGSALGFLVLLGQGYFNKTNCCVSFCFGENVQNMYLEKQMNQIPFNFYDS